jgi:hypothetical protein
MVERQSSKLVMRVRFPLPAPSMNVCHELKTVLWLPPRTASRAVAPQFRKFNFINCYYNNPIGYVNYEHELSIPKGCENYDIICTVRNPYSWLLSIWHWDNFYPGVAEKDRVSYAEFVETRSSHLESIMENILKVEIKYLIHYESIKEDLFKIPWFDANPEQVNYSLKNNGCISENLIRCSDNKNYSDYLKHYTKKELDIVSTKFLPLFKKIGYSSIV